MLIHLAIHLSDHLKINLELNVAAPLRLLREINFDNEYSC